MTALQIAALCAPSFMAIAALVGRLSWIETIDEWEGLVVLTFWRKLFIGMGLIFLLGSYLTDFSGLAIFYGAIGGEILLAVAIGYLSARHAVSKIVAQWNKRSS